MDSTPDITVIGLIFCFMLLAIPLLADRILGLGMGKKMMVSVARMSVQLLLVGIFLAYIFDLDNLFITVLWLAVMICFASYSTVRNSGLKLRRFIIPIMLSLVIGTVPILIFFNGIVVGLADIMDPRYAIAIGGMLLGNAIKGMIVALSDLYKNIRRNRTRYHYRLSLGATSFEAKKQFYRDSMLLALKPTLASVATMGIVFLPGMMTGQILAGLSPVSAIKYQIAIMIVLFSATTLAIALGIYFTQKISFSPVGLLKDDIFSK